MEETDNDLMAALSCKDISDMAVKGLCGLEVAICLLRITDKLRQFKSLFFFYDMRSSRTLIDGQAINPFLW